MLFKWQRDAYAEPVDWEPDITFSSDTSGPSRRHYFDLETLKRLQDASLEFVAGNLIPHRRERRRKR